LRIGLGPDRGDRQHGDRPDQRMFSQEMRLPDFLLRNALACWRF
jgi:hypothetical protein